MIFSTEFTGDDYIRPPHRPSPRVRPMSIEILDRMGSLVKILSEAHVDSKEALYKRQEELTRLQNYVLEIEASFVSC